MHTVTTALQSKPADPIQETITRINQTIQTLTAQVDYDIEFLQHLQEALKGLVKARACLREAFVEETTSAGKYKEWKPPALTPAPSLPVSPEIVERWYRAGLPTGD